jgi:ABC-type bacteriocin/lantibiotic exporter with double-glycine peptidase domain
MEANEMKYIVIMAVIMMIVSPGLLTTIFTVALILAVIYILPISDIVEKIMTKQVK